MSESVFASITIAPPNEVLGLANDCKKDESNEKIDLTIGAYRNNEGVSYKLDCVRDAENTIVQNDMDHEYLPQDGLSEFNNAVQILLFGESSRVRRQNRVHTIQGLGGTGSLRLSMEFLKLFFKEQTIYLPTVSWENHSKMVDNVGLKSSRYRYLDSSGCALDISGLLQDLRACPMGSIVLLHMCAHNPTGVDPTEDQWRLILQVVIERRLFPIFDNAYQGFVSGNPTTDAFSVRLFADAGIEMIVACSFSKNFGLYGQRVGAVHVITSNSSTLPAIASQLRVISRTLYSNCPLHGVRLVSCILNSPSLKVRWEQECKLMADRLSSIRSQLYQLMIQYKVPGDWSHISSQRGMFSYTGIPGEVVIRLRKEYHIYMLENGRISLSGLNTNNINRFVQAVAKAMNDNSSINNYSSL